MSYKPEIRNLCIVQLNMIYQELISSPRDRTMTRNSHVSNDLQNSYFFKNVSLFTNVQKQLSKQSQLHPISTS